jgi:hypothetical protein
MWRENLCDKVSLFEKQVKDRSLSNKEQLNPWNSSTWNTIVYIVWEEMNR